MRQCMRRRRDAANPNFCRGLPQLVGYLWGHLGQRYRCVDGRVHGCVVRDCPLFVPVSGPVRKKIDVLEGSEVVVVVRTG